MTKGSWIKLNIAVIVLYIVSNISNNYINIQFLTLLFGTIQLFVLTPANFYLSLRLRLKGLFEFVIYVITFYFFIYAPLFYFAANRTQYLNYDVLTIQLVNGLYFIMYLLSLVLGRKIRYFRDKSKTVLRLRSKKYYKDYFLRHKLLLIIFLIYFLIHSANFILYRLVPGGDTYADMIKILRVMKTGSYSDIFRPFYYSSTSIISVFGQVKPYYFFTPFFIFLQFSYIVVLYKFLSIFNIKKFAKYIILISALAIPVLNMEIDIVRAQSLVVIFFPVYLYFQYMALISREKIYWILSTLIAIGGINAHQLFSFITLLHLSISFYYLLRRFLLHSKNKKDKLIFVMGICLIISLIFNFIGKESQTIHYLKLSLDEFFNNIVDFAEWKIWFVDGYYSSPSNYASWPGLGGALRYYTYHLGPVIFFLLAWVFVLGHKKDSESKGGSKRYLNRMILPLLILLFLIAEIFPRINYTNMPERAWILIDLLLLFLIIPYANQIDIKKRKSLIILYSFLLVGVLGVNFYLADLRQSTITKDEMKSADWIVDNLPDDSIFYIQKSNEPLIAYFAERKILVPGEGFFLNDDFESAEEMVEDFYVNQEKALERGIDELEYYFDRGGNSRILREKFGNDLYNEKYDHDKARKYIKLFENPIYIMYSEDKFDHKFANDISYRRKNFYDANLDKFDTNLEKVYDQEGIHIWRFTSGINND